MKHLLWYKKLFTGIIFWMLLLSIVPLAITGWISYQQSSQNIKESAITELQHTAKLYQSFIENWFDDRQQDILSVSEQESTLQVIKTLENEFKQSHQDLYSFTHSYKYATIISNLDESYQSLMLIYQYIGDIYLLDTQGNVLYSVSKGEDFSTNFIYGKYALSKHSLSYVQSLKDGKIHFSDLEHYAASNNEVFGFLTSPIIGENGDVLGVLSYKIRVDTITQLFNNVHLNQKGLNHYLIGEDLLLRTPLNSDEMDYKILKNYINTHLTRAYKDQINHDPSIAYMGVNSKKQFGIFNLVDIVGVHWILISEYDSQALLKSNNKIAMETLNVSLITIFIVLFIALIIANNITRPITALANSTREIINGKSFKSVSISSENEIGQLANAFNLMNEKQQRYIRNIELNDKLTQEALEELEEQKMAIDAHAIIEITDAEGTITYVNDKFCEVSGYSQNELIGHNHRIVNSGRYTKEFWKAMYKHLLSGKIWTHKSICNRKKNGELYWVDTTIVPSMSNDALEKKVKGYIAIRTDVTEQIINKRALIKSKEDAEAATKIKADFLASMSHEIRTPMNGVLGMLDLVSQTTLNDDQTHKIEVAKSSANALLSVINDILDFSKLEAGKVDIEWIEFNVIQELEHLLEATQVNIKDKNVKLSLDSSALEHTIFKADIGRLKQILINIIGNAIKFTPEGEILVRVFTREAKEIKKLKLCFSVKDSGIGIPQEKLALLFDSFTQVDTSTTRKYGGTGLGLSIVKTLVELMGGKISVKSELNVGTTFSFEIDTFMVDESSITQKQEEQKEVTQSFNENGNILLVEDNITNQLVASGILENLGLEIDIANNGQEALDMIKEAKVPYTLVFMDCQMPIMDGFEATDKLRESKNTIHIVAMTANSMEGDKEKCIAHGMDDYISKPLDVQKLKEILYKWL